MHKVQNSSLVYYTRSLLVDNVVIVGVSSGRASQVFSQKQIINPKFRHLYLKDRDRDRVRVHLKNPLESVLFNS